MRITATTLLLLATVASTPAGAQTYEGPSPFWATVVSAGMTAAGAGLLATHEHFGIPGAASALLLGAVGVTVGPSAGFFYIGERGRGALSLGIRAVTLVGVGHSVRDDAEPSAMLLWSAAAVFGASTIYDIATVGGAARAIRARSRLDVGVDPRTHSVRVGATIGF